jgi:hypothetical protein
VRALDDRATGVRVAAADGLLATTDSSLLRSLERYVDDPVTSIRYAAWDASTKLTKSD